jgi:hypothetical protein
LRHPQNPGQHRFALQKSQQLSTIPGMNPNIGIERVCRFTVKFLDQLLESEFLQYRDHRKQPSVGRQISCIEVKGRGSTDFIKL